MLTDKYQLLACPKCGSAFKKNRNFLICLNCKNKLIIKDGIVVIGSNLDSNSIISQNKWEQNYHQQLINKTYFKDFKQRYPDLYQYDYLQIFKSQKIYKNQIFLEIGCGPFFESLIVASKFSLVIGIDFSPSALKIAQKMLESQGIKNYLLIQSDLNNLPLKSNTIDYIYGGGVLEHFDQTKRCLSELNRILKPNGICINTVPIVNLASLTYRQLWGNIPDIPVIKQIFEFVHIKLLKSKHMFFGYERSFFIPSLKKVHIQSGFRQVKVSLYQNRLQFDFLPKLIRPLCRYLATNSILFWPMAMFEAKK